MHCEHVGVKSWFSGFLTFGCRKCGSCYGMLRKQKASCVMLESESHFYGENAPVGVCFLLTYSGKHLPLVADGSAATLRQLDVSRFLKRLRSRCFPVENRKKAAAGVLRETLGIRAGNLRYAVSGEYGEGRGRPHYHLILFGFPWCERDAGTRDLSCQCRICRFYRDVWGHGRVSCPKFGFGAASYLTALYTTKSLMKSGHDDLRGREPEFFQTSKGFGDAAVMQHAEEVVEDISEGVEVEDFPLWLPAADGGKAYLSSRQRKRGRVAIGRSASTPGVVLHRLSMRYPELLAKVSYLSGEERVAEFKRLVREYRAAKNLERHRLRNRVPKNLERHRARNRAYQKGKYVPVAEMSSEERLVFRELCRKKYERRKDKRERVE